MPSNQPRVAFFGTPDIAAQTLSALEKAGYNIVVVVTAPDRPVGRKQIITPSAVKTWATERNIPVLQPESLKDDFLDQFRNFEPDISITAAYGQIIPKSVWQLPKHQTLNIHYSLLPRHRGAIPTQATLLFGDQVAGVTVQQMRSKLDTGPIVIQKEIPLHGKELAPDLQNTLTQLGAEALVEILPSYLDGAVELIEQDESQATYSGKLDKSDGQINLSDPDLDNWHKYQAYYGWPRIFYFDEAGIRTIVTEADFVDGKFVIKKVLPAGGTERTIV